MHWRWWWRRWGQHNWRDIALADFMSNPAEYDDFLIFTEYPDETIARADVLWFEIEHLRETLILFDIQVAKLQNHMIQILKKCCLLIQLYNGDGEHDLSEYIMRSRAMLYKLGREKCQKSRQMRELTHELRVRYLEMDRFWDTAYLLLLQSRRSSVGCGYGIWHR